ncbi:xylose isomerase [Paracoccus aerodenitrificans]|uniref:xylose isomerase n=1 Tax=Paracoccus aerodenitrificans TaxID=3017781 RepID=UPI0022F06154|nr:xylose isomerase [Paracoccus aerodenitrificans]WBU64309.1 xylose isomerase [Paracoccus aerodenitrificans]
MINDDFSLGCNGRGLMHTQELPLEDQFRMLRDSGVFDHFDRIPQPGLEREYVEASNKYGVPLTTGLWTYQIGKDEDLVRHNLEWAAKAGAKCHNLMISTNHAKGHVVTDDEVVEFYLRAYEAGESLGITISAEVHIYMFTEDFRRITPVAEKVRSRGVPFNFVLDHSHVLLKIESPEEQDASGIREDVETGRLILDPYDEGNVIDEWIDQNMIVWLQVRPVSPNGPKNTGMMGPGGRWGRACQYPFTRPGPGEWDHFWHAYRVEPCKEVVRKVFRHHRDTPDSPLRWMTTDMIDMPDYGGGVGYSLFDQNVAIAEWIRDTWQQIVVADRPKQVASPAA